VAASPRYSGFCISRPLRGLHFVLRSFPSSKLLVDCQSAYAYSGNYFCARPSSTNSFLPFLKVSIACAPGFEIDAFKCSLLIQTLDVVSNKYRRSVVGTGFAGHLVQLKLVSEEGMVQHMLWTILLVLLILWLLGLIGGIGGNLVHLLLVIALVVLIIQLITGRRAVV
jgi:hypothetical protein